MQSGFRAFVKKAAGYIPATANFLRAGTGGTTSARYCYSVWLRHLVMADKNGLATHPEVIAELGPGDSLGIGLAALLSGANVYYALDVVTYSTARRNIAVLNELVDLFSRREDIPDEAEFPEAKPYLDSYGFPGRILSEERLGRTLRPDRIKAVGRALLKPGNSEEGPGVRIFYFVPWHDPGVIRKETVDMVYSQAVLEHVEDLGHTYQSLYAWLRPGGIMSHQIDFKSHGLSREWNGHWTYSDSAWARIKNKQAYLINRQPHSAHLQLMQKYGFEIVCDCIIRRDSQVQRGDLAAGFKNLSDSDLTTSGAFIQAVKKAQPA